MKTAPLKTFATAARTKLLAQVSAQLDRVRLDDGAYQREHAAAISKLEDRIRAVGKAAVIDEVAYTWFNRLVALRYMDVNDYSPVRAVSPRDPAGLLPELLQEAKRGLIPEDLPVKRQRVFDLLDGKLPSPDGQNEAYRLLLVADCNRRATQLPFLFQRIDDYTELLLPPDLLSKQSILHDLRTGMDAEVCAENEEVIGWLYQFYIAEKKAEVDKAKKKRKVRPDEIPAVTQLFTPRWIVEYMVQNTLGKLWLESHPDSRLRGHMPYYIEGEEAPPTNGNSGSHIVNRTSSIVNRKSLTPQDLTLADQACGSGHILLYAFELLTHIYEEAGYTKSAIPGHILEHNLTGFEIDERAAQLAGFSLMMRARRYHRRALSKELCPRIIRFKPLTLPEERIATFLQPGEELTADLNDMREVANLGSLIVPRSSPSELRRARTQVKSQSERADLFAKDELERLDGVLEQLQELQRKFSAVVDNPPYLGGSNFNARLKKYVKSHYPLSKSDLMATFMERGLAALEEGGYLGMINQHSWMFLSSYEKLRKDLIGRVHFDTMLHLGPRAFPEIGGEVVQSTAFTFRNAPSENSGSYLRLVDFGTDEKASKTRAAIQNPTLDYFYRARQEDFAKIPGWPVGYFFSLSYFRLFSSSNTVEDVGEARQGIATGNNPQFVRGWFEVSVRDINRSASTIDEFFASRAKYAFFNKGGGRDRWYGILEDVIRFDKESYELLAVSGNKLPSKQYYFKPGISFSKVSTANASFRKLFDGNVFSDSGQTIFEVDDNDLMPYLNSATATHILKLISPTLNYTLKDIRRLPFKHLSDDSVADLANQAVATTMLSASFNEMSIDSCKSNLFLSQQIGSQKLKSLLAQYTEVIIDHLISLHRVEEMINKRIDEVYLQQGTTLVCVKLEGLTIYNDIIDSDKLTKLNKKLRRDPTTGLVTNYNEIELPFKRDEIMAQFVSYAVGCMMGRYSLDKEGLILANAGDTLREYTERVGKQEVEWTFAPDADGILPVLAGDFFEDDIVGRFRAFLLAAFGEAHFSENLAFVEECLESKEDKSVDIRKYFTRYFYKDHVQRYKKRPIYWLFSSPAGHFQALVYLHRYTPDTVNRLLNDYLRPYVDKLEARRAAAVRVQDDAVSSGRDKVAADRTIKDCDAALADCRAYERDTLYPLALRRLPLDLDDGVLVNYNKLGDAVLTVPGLNDNKKRKQVEGFGWVEFEWGA